MAVADLSRLEFRLQAGKISPTRVNAVLQTDEPRNRTRLAQSARRGYNARMAPSTIKLSDELETRIRDALAPLHPEKVILFGSYAWGQPTEGSDIDLYVVTQDDFVPATYEERMQNYLKVAALLREINKSVPIDLIVHTRPGALTCEVQHG